MKSRISGFFRSLKQVGFFIPFTFYFLIFFVGGYIGYYLLRDRTVDPESAFAAVYKLLIRFAFWFAIIIICVGLLSGIVSYLFFLWRKKKSGIDFRMSATQEKHAKQTIKIHISPILIPLLGFIKIRLKYDNTHFSEKFLLVKQSQNKLFSTMLDGLYYWQLPEIKEYRVEKAIIYFEDFLQFFSLAVSVNTSNSFHTQPMETEAKTISAFPRKTEETTTRIEEIKKVEGEYLSYKNFESNDDVRRIVWKIYAKNKELVVRIPEILDPYASHIYLYPSFYSLYDSEGNDVLEIPFLNYYKTILWSVYKQLLHKGCEIRYVADQDIPQHKMQNDSEQIKYTISVSSWQRNKGLKEFVKTKDASIVVVSSLTDINELEEMVQQFGNEIAFIFVPLTESLNKQHIGDWLQWLFVQQEKDVVAKFKTNWSLSLLRLKISQNEKQIKKLLESYDKSTVMQKVF